MDHPFSYHQPLAQMPTDQREHEQHRVLVQTGLSADGLFQVPTASDNLQPYHPGPPVQNWPALRPNLIPQAPMSLHHTGVSSPWGATLGPYNLGTSPLTYAQMPDDTYLASLYSTPHAANMPSMFASSTTTMHQPNTRAPRHLGDHNDLINRQTLPVTASWSQEHLNHSPQHPHTPQGSGRVMRETLPSPPISISSDHSRPHSSHPHLSHDSMSPALTVTAVDSPSPRVSLADSSDQEHTGEPPYSRLIWEALMSTNDKMLPLQGIYQWFEKNTTKGKNEESKGWQNSIRHNLSMNAGFEAIKVEATGKKAVNYWRLTEEAIRNGGVQSTTRYRKLTTRKAMSSDPPDPRRQRPGSKGGKKSAGIKRHATEDEEEDPSRPGSALQHRNVRQNRSPPLYPESHTHFHSHAQPQPQLQPQLQLQLPPQPPVLTDVDIPHFQHYNNTYLTAPPVEISQYSGLPGLNGLPRLAHENWQQFDLRDVIGTTSQPPADNMVFCNTAEVASDCAAFVGHWVGVPQAQGPIIMD